MPIDVAIRSVFIDDTRMRVTITKVAPSYFDRFGGSVSDINVEINRLAFDNYRGCRDDNNLDCVPSEAAYLQY
jgi:hypothetical protein